MTDQSTVPSNIAALTELTKTRKKMERFSLYTVAAFTLLVFIAAFVIKIGGAVVAEGIITRQGQNIEVQHADGGAVEEVFITNGQRVSKGDLLIKLDGTEVEAEWQRLDRQRVELEVKLARLKSSRSSSDTIEYPQSEDELSASLEEILNVQGHVLSAEKAYLASERSRIRQRVSGAKAEQDALIGQVRANEARAELVKEEIRELSALVADGLVSRSRMTQLEREALEIDQRLEAFKYESTRLDNVMREARESMKVLEREATDRNWRETNDTEIQLADILQSLAVLSGRRERLIITAPETGRIHELMARNSEAVLQAGDTILTIVPEENARQIEVKVSPNDIDQIYAGQNVRLRFDTFDTADVEEFVGAVSNIAPDRSTDAITGLPFYAIEVAVEANNEEMIRLNPGSGSPVTAFFETGERSMLDYLLKPLSRSIARTFKEG